MKKNFKWMLSLLVAVFAVSMIGNTAFAESFENIEDGDYDIDVTALEEGSDETSVADDFVHNPTLTIQDGNPTLTLGIGAGGGNFSDFDFSIEWVQVEGKDPIDESEKGDLTYYTFQLDNLDTIVPAGMNYVVPSLDMDHDVAFRLKLNLDELPVKQSGEEPENPEDHTEGEGTIEDNDEGDNGNGTVEENSDNDEDKSGAVTDNGDNSSGTTDGEEVTNPQTGDTTNIWPYALLLIGSILVPSAILIKRRFAA